MDNNIAAQVLQSQDKDGMLRRALERIIQLYTDKSHFVYELLQNAEDAGASIIRFEQYEDHLTVLHDGHPFTIENLQGLCDIGKSDKIDDLNQIGEFGVGFKSVFGICDIVKLYSHPSEEDKKNGYHQFAVEIRDFTHPVDIEDVLFGEEYTTKFVFPYSIGFTFSGFQSIDKLNNVLSKRLQNIGITTLLFMKSLKAIDYQIELPSLKTSGRYSLKKKDINDHCSLISASGETDEKKSKEEIVSYLLFSRPIEGIQSKRTIDIAFTVKINDDGSYKFIKTKHPYISVFFPTETESKLNFIVQGPYRTTPNRSSVPQDDSDNLNLAKQTATLLYDSVRELRDKGILDLSLLNVLPINRDRFESAPLFKCLYEKTVVMMKKERFLICRDGNYEAPNNVKIARGENFAELFSDSLITELLDDGKKYHWLPTVLTETNREYKELYSFLTDILKISVLRPEIMRNYFNKNTKFLKRRNDEWLVKMYQLYENVGAAFSKQRKSESNMLTCVFVKTTKGEFVAPYIRAVSGESYSFDFLYGDYENATYLPNVFLPSKRVINIDDIHFVDKSILSQCEHFFKEILALQIPNEYEIFIRDYKRRCEAGVKNSNDQHIDDIKQLLKYRTNFERQDEVNSIIQKYLTLRCIKNNRIQYINPRKEKVYLKFTSEGINIEYYLKNVTNSPFVDSEFYTSYGINEENLVALGVRNSVAVGINKTCGEYYTGRSGRQPEWNTYYGFWWKLNLEYLEEVLQYISSNPSSSDAMAKSGFIFQFLRTNEQHLKGTVYIGGSTPNKNDVYSEIVSMLRGDLTSYRHSRYQKWDGKWLFTEDGDLVSQKEIRKKDLMQQLYGDSNNNSQIYEYLGFIKSQEEILRETEKDYDKLSDVVKDNFFAIEFQRRFGIPVDEGKEILEGKASPKNGKKRLDSKFEFPSSKVKNWDSLRKHVEEVLCFANPVKYDYVVHRIRVSKPVDDVQAYLKNMYKVDNREGYACQMCHDAFSKVEMCQIANRPDLELDAMNICLCRNCAAEYKMIRKNPNRIDSFLKKICMLKDMEIKDKDPVKIDLDGESIWFTQTHVAEIRELIKLRDEVDNFNRMPNASINSNKKVKKDDHTINVYKEYVGKKIYHRGYQAYGKVISCDGVYIDIKFYDGKSAGMIKRFSLQTCLKNSLLEMS